MPSHHHRTKRNDLKGSFIYLTARHSPLLRPLRKSKSYNAIMISSELLREKVERSKSFEKLSRVRGALYRERLSGWVGERRITGASRNGGNIGCVTWSIYFYHFIYRKRLYSAPFTLACLLLMMLCSFTMSFFLTQCRFCCCEQISFLSAVSSVSGACLW